jgi:hypothetical protein
MSKIIILLITLFSFYTYGQNTDFPMIISKLDTVPENSKIEKYSIDSIKIRLGENDYKFLKFIVNIQNPELSIKRDYNARTVEISLDFDGYRYIEVNNVLVLAYNPYFGKYSKLIIYPKHNGIENIGLVFNPVMIFSESGDLIYYPFICEEKIDSIKEINSLRRNFLNRLININSIF